MLRKLIVLLVICLSTSLICGKNDRKRKQRKAKQEPTVEVTQELPSSAWLQPKRTEFFVPASMVPGLLDLLPKFKDLTSFPNARKDAPAFFKLTDNWPMIYINHDGSFGMHQTRDISETDWFKVLGAFYREIGHLSEQYPTGKEDVIIVGVGRSPSFMVSMLAEMGWETYQMPFSRRGLLKVQTRLGTTDADIFAYTDAYLRSRFNEIMIRAKGRKIVVIDSVCNAGTLEVILTLFNIEMMKYPKAEQTKIDVWGWDVSIPEVKDIHQERRSKIQDFESIDKITLRSIVDDETLKRVMLFDELNWIKPKSLYPQGFPQIVLALAQNKTLVSLQSPEHIALVRHFIHNKINRDTAPSTEMAGGAGSKENYFKTESPLVTREKMDSEASPMPGTVGGGGGADGDEEEELVPLWDVRNRDEDSREALPPSFENVRFFSSTIFMAIISGLIAPDNWLKKIKGI